MTQEQVHDQDCWSEDELNIRRRTPREKVSEIIILYTDWTGAQGSATRKFRSSIELNLKRQKKTQIIKFRGRINYVASKTVRTLKS